MKIMDQDKSKVESIIETLRRKLEAKERKLEKLNARPKEKEKKLKSRSSLTNSPNLFHDSFNSSFNKSSRGGFRVPNPVKIINKTDSMAFLPNSVSEAILKPKKPITCVQTLKFNEVEIFKQHEARLDASDCQKTTSEANLSNICEEKSFNLNGASLPRIDKMQNAWQYEESAPLFDRAPILSPINTKISGGLVHKEPEEFVNMNVEVTTHSDLLLLSETSDSQKIKNHFEYCLAIEKDKTLKTNDIEENNITSIITPNKSGNEKADSQSSLDSQTSRKSSRKRKNINYAQIFKKDKRVKVDETEIALLSFQILTQMAKDLPQEDFHLPLMYIQSNNRRLNHKKLYTDVYSDSELVNFSCNSPKAEKDFNDTNKHEKTEVAYDSDNGPRNSLAADSEKKLLHSESPVPQDEDNLNYLSFSPQSNGDMAKVDKTNIQEVNGNVFENENQYLPINFPNKTNQIASSCQNELNDEINKQGTKKNNNNIEAIVDEENIFEDEMLDLPITLKNIEKGRILLSDEKSVSDKGKVINNEPPKGGIEDNYENENPFEYEITDLPMTLKIEAKEHILSSSENSISDEMGQISMTFKNGDKEPDSYPNKEPVTKGAVEVFDEEENLFEDETPDLSFKLHNAANGKASMSKNVLVSNIIELSKKKSDTDTIGVASNTLKELCLSQIDNEKPTARPEKFVVKEKFEELNLGSVQESEKMPNETQMTLCKIILNVKAPDNHETSQAASNPDSNKFAKVPYESSIDKPSVLPSNRIISQNGLFPPIDNKHMDNNISDLEDQNTEMEDVIGPTQEEPKTTLPNLTFEKRNNAVKCQEAKAINKIKKHLSSCNDDSGIFVGRNSKAVLIRENEENVLGKRKEKSKNYHVLKDIVNIHEDVELGDRNKAAATQVPMESGEREKCIKDSLTVKVERSSCFRCSKLDPVKKIHFIEGDDPLIVVQQSMSLTIFNMESNILEEICTSMHENILNSFLINNYIVLVIGGNEKYLLLINSKNFALTKHQIPNCLPEIIKVLSCPLEHPFFATCPVSPHSYTLTVHKVSSDGKIKSRSLEKSEEIIIDISLVHNMERAIAGIMENGVFLWSYYSGKLLRKVHFDQIVSPFRICWIYRDSGLFYYIIKWRNSEKNCLIVANPITGKHQILLEYKNGMESNCKLDCFVTKVFYTELIANKKLIIYNLLSGTEVASHICTELSASNLVYQENQKHIVLTGYDNGCVHLFTM